MIVKSCQEDCAQQDFVREEFRWSDEIEELVRRFARTWAHRFRFRKEDGEDMEQDAVLLAFTKVKSGLITSREGLWILVRNSCFDAWGRNQPDCVALKDEFYTVGFSGLNRAIVEQVGAEIPELIPLAEARAAGYSWDEISDAFGIPSGTLRVQWSRMTAKARKLFGNSLADVLQA